MKKLPLGFCILSVFMLCAAPTCAQIDVPKNPPPTAAPGMVPQSTTTPTELSSEVPSVIKERDDRMNQLAILVATLCIDVSADKYAVDETCLNRGLYCIITKPEAIWSNAAEVLQCALDARKQPTAGE